MKLIFIPIFCVFLLMTKASAKDNGTVSTPAIENAILSCKCGEFGEEFRKDIDMSMVLEILKGIIESRSTHFEAMSEYPRVIGEYLRNCSKCEVLLSMCREDPNKKYSRICNKGSLGFWIPINGTVYQGYKNILMDVKNQISSFLYGHEGKNAAHITKREARLHPIQVHVPLGGLKKRVKRQREACHYPTSLQTSQLDCTLYGTGANCTQTCGFGYTLPEGRKVQYSCKNKDNKWHPKNFRECRPFVDCTVTLISGGYAKCRTPSVKSAPSCDIKCEKYEDKEEIGAERYTCDIRGKWEPQLPFCTVPGSGLELVQKPDGQE